ncbi:MAG TPA: hypothetical protein P5205_17910 [Candidatus Paceibacterota bacterium]|nr:hypothetical protein [Verrucomicrobiota bacterium]HSA12240.1 hypothetical protein [Candidatus Paceibacterota bacterium]
MKARLISRHEGSLDFFLTPVRCADGGQGFMEVVFGGNGAMWVDPRVVGVGPEHAGQLEAFGGPYLLVNPAEQRVLINARAVVLAKNDPEWCRRWLVFVEKMVKEHEAVREGFDTARNN